jgi:hypothetical protein
LALDDGNLLSRTGQIPGKQLADLAATEDDHVVLFHFRHWRFLASEWRLPMTLLAIAVVSTVAPPSTKKLDAGDVVAVAGKPAAARPC